MGSKVWLIDQGKAVEAEILGQARDVLALKIEERILVRHVLDCFPTARGAIDQQVAVIQTQIASLQQDRDRILREAGLPNWPDYGPLPPLPPRR